MATEIRIWLTVVWTLTDDWPYRFSTVLRARIGDRESSGQYSNTSSTHRPGMKTLAFVDGAGAALRERSVFIERCTKPDHPYVTGPGVTGCAGWVRGARNPELTGRFVRLGAGRVGAWCTREAPGERDGRGSRLAHSADSGCKVPTPNAHHSPVTLTTITSIESKS